MSSPLDYQEQLATEAAAVGAMLIPVVWVVSGVLERLPLNDRFRSAATLFVSGATFHLAAEWAGFNQWFLTHSAAARKTTGDWIAACKSAPLEKKPCGINFCPLSSSQAQALP